MVIYKAAITGITETEQFEVMATLTQDNLDNCLKSAIEIFNSEVTSKTDSTVKSIKINLIKTDK
tara:strand:+ start:15382 stop:15573 length:192 start_codon:yes stop_codon:yes gene_type:complete